MKLQSTQRQKRAAIQEGGVCVTFRWHVQIPLRIRYSESWRWELSIGRFMGPLGEGGGGGGIWGGSEFFGPPLPPLQKFAGPLLRDFKNISGILSSNPVDWHPFCANIIATKMGQNGAVLGQIPHYGPFSAEKKTAKGVPKRVENQVQPNLVFSIPNDSSLCKKYFCRVLRWKKPWLGCCGPKHEISVPNFELRFCPGHWGGSFCLKFCTKKVTFQDFCSNDHLWQFTPNIQDCAGMRYSMEFWRNGSNVGLCKPVMGAW